MIGQHLGGSTRSDDRDGRTRRHPGWRRMVGDGHAVLQVGGGGSEHPPVPVDGAAVDHLHQQLRVARVEEVEQRAGILQAQRLQAACRSSWNGGRGVAGADLEPSFVQTRLTRGRTAAVAVRVFPLRQATQTSLYHSGTCGARLWADPIMRPTFESRIAEAFVQVAVSERPLIRHFAGPFPRP